MSDLDIQVEHVQCIQILAAKIQFKIKMGVIQIHGLVEKASFSKSGEMDLIPAGCWYSLQPLCHFAWH